MTVYSELILRHAVGVRIVGERVAIGGAEIDLSHSAGDIVAGAELKQQMGLRRVRLRRTWNVAEQFLLAATAQNLKRMVRFLAQREASALSTA